MATAKASAMASAIPRPATAPVYRRRVFALAVCSAGDLRLAAKQERRRSERRARQVRPRTARGAGRTAMRVGQAITYAGHAEFFTLLAAILEERGLPEAGRLSEHTLEETWQEALRRVDPTR